jgi:predicted tellurium resistance membrane protein TerC
MMSFWQILLISFGFVLLIAGLNQIQKDRHRQDQKTKDEIRELKNRLLSSETKSKYKHKKRLKKYFR